jgi:hypothetical protein
MTTKTPTNDPVQHPAHYTAGGIECIDAIKAALTCHKDPIAAWLTGQIIKYMWRWPLKNGLEDLRKAKFYLDRLIEHTQTVAQPEQEDREW